MTDYSKHYPNEHLLIVAKKRNTEDEVKKNSALVAELDLFFAWQRTNEKAGVL